MRLVEVDVGAANFDEGHIDGAVLWNVYRDLKDGDYRLVETGALVPVQRSGIGRDSTVVFYGYAPAMGLWLMKLYGHAESAFSTAPGPHGGTGVAVDRALDSPSPAVRSLMRTSGPCTPLRGERPSAVGRSSSMSAASRSSGASGSGRPAVSSRAAGPATSRPRCTCRSKACKIRGDRSAPRPG